VQCIVLSFVQCRDVLGCAHYGIALLRLCVGQLGSTTLASIDVVLLPCLLLLLVGRAAGWAASELHRFAVLALVVLLVLLVLLVTHVSVHRPSGTPLSLHWTHKGPRHGLRALLLRSWGDGVHPHMHPALPLNIPYLGQRCTKRLCAAMQSVWCLLSSVSNLVGGEQAVRAVPLLDSVLG